MSKIKDKYEAMLKEWENFVSGNPVNKKVIHEHILKSWEEARKLNIDPYLSEIPQLLSEDELQEVQEKHDYLIKTSYPFLENLYNFVITAGFGSRYICSLSDSEGTLIFTLGNPEVMETLSSWNYRPGACMQEKYIGTNGAGAVIRLDKPVQIFGSEHYCLMFHKYTCSSAPIHDHEGNILGVLNMVCPCPNAHSHTLGMVVAAANAIEKNLQIQKAYRETQIAENLKNAVICSIPEALVAIDNQGDIIFTNENARSMFQVGEDIVGRNIKEFLGSENAKLFPYLLNGTNVIDKQIPLFINSRWANYMLTTQTIKSCNNETYGKVIIFSEIKRAKKLVADMIGAKAKFTFSHIVSRNPRFLKLIEIAKIASKTDSNVLLFGESGTGKDIFAQAIHNEGMRSGKPFVAINCSAIPRELIASELFGYAEGAFTGSVRGGNPGKFELADGGTIFLDEIGEMPLELQSILLRVIENKEIMRIGGKNIIPVDVKIIAATNKDLKEEILKRNFREDLYYRLNVFSIELFPLRERTEDIPLLVINILKKLNKCNNRGITKVDKNVLEMFERYPWPGNVRELQNILERSYNIAGGETITSDDIPREIIYSGSAGPEQRSAGAAVEQKESVFENYPTLEDMEKKIICDLIQSNVSKSKIASHLNISRNTLYRKMVKYNLPY